MKKEYSYEELLRLYKERSIEVENLKSKLNIKNRKIRVLEKALEEKSMTARMRACIDETLSCIDDIEYLKGELKKMEAKKCF